MTIRHILKICWLGLNQIQKSLRYVDHTYYYRSIPRQETMRCVITLAQTFHRKAPQTDLALKLARELAGKFRQVCKPERIILFGSAAEGRFVEGSDLDFLLVLSDVPTLQKARRDIRALGRLSPTIPIDLVFVSKDQFEAKKNLGGICFIAEHDGQDL